MLGFYPGTPVSSTNKTDCHDITEILLKVAEYLCNSTIGKFYAIYLLASIMKKKFEQ
jgi:hypothetical protein